jgi:hypothetical protein
VERRRFLPLLLLSVPCLGAEPSAVTVRGKLTTGPGGEPALQSADGKLTLLTGDEATVGVLKDARLAGSDFEAAGHSTGVNQFAIDPIHTRSLFVYKDGKRQMVTYWCDICYIRTYTPGNCWCCQQDTRLDLRDPDKVDKK